MISIKNVTKKYGDKLALNDISLDIKDGEIFGLIGHNGAGKSTTIKSLVSIIDPTIGEIWIDEKELSKNRNEIKKMIGYVSDSPDMFLKMQALEFWRFIADIYEVPENEVDSRLEFLYSEFDMKKNANGIIEDFSHGMRQKTFLIAALLPNPRIWILDEPMTGLDPQSAYNLKELMKKHAQEGNTVLFSTHVLEVAEQLCDRIGILSKGKLLFVGTMDELRGIHPGRSLEEIYLGMVNSAENTIDIVNEPENEK
ncbi:ABC transporter ATP-binding protein [Peptostreptococcus faecalis]|uniref:ABC transporter ATP-binding protein n=1 Tax=Peptostreptococcus faecalis TaxID=2045015 RepID=UPI000C79FC92|nr:ABC transporter ATP-binding protein [Peptostreptococcus faecalis]